MLENSGVPLEKLANIADRKNNRISANDLFTNNYNYIGLSCIDSNIGHISFNNLEDISGSCALFEGEDIIFSKLRPYLNKVAICPPELKRCAGSTELVVYRAKKTVNPYYLFFVLKSPLTLNQVIKITSGSTHPRVDPELIDQIIIPIAKGRQQEEIGAFCKQSLRLLSMANEYVLDAKSNVEALIEEKLDTDAILSGKLKAPTWEDIEKELEGI